MAYVFDTFAYAMLPTYADYENIFLTVVAVPSVIAELAFTVWLLARAGKRIDEPPVFDAPAAQVPVVATALMTRSRPDPRRIRHVTTGWWTIGRCDDRPSG